MRTLFGGLTKKGEPAERRGAPRTNSLPPMRCWPGRPSSTTLFGPRQSGWLGQCREKKDSFLGMVPSTGPSSSLRPAPGGLLPPGGL